MSKLTMWRSRWRCVIKPAYSVSFLLSINIFVWQNVLYLLDAPRITIIIISCIMLIQILPHEMTTCPFPLCQIQFCVRVFVALKWSPFLNCHCGWTAKEIEARYWRTYRDVFPLMNTLQASCGKIRTKLAIRHTNLHYLVIQKNTDVIF